jgi:hypothetical protein
MSELSPWSDGTPYPPHWDTLTGTVGLNKPSPLPSKSINTTEDVNGSHDEVLNIFCIS